MKRVDPDCADEIFAEMVQTAKSSGVDRQFGTGALSEHDLLTGIEAIIEFVHAASHRKSTSKQRRMT